MKPPRLNAILLVLIFAGGALYGAAPTGQPAEPTPEEKAAMERLGKEIDARIVWSTSRNSGLHDIYIMNAGGNGRKALTQSRNVDWFPRFSPDGSKVLFVRSRAPWTSESAAHYNERWHLFTVNSDGSDEKQVAEHACWGTWVPETDGKKIMFARKDQVYVKDLETGKEELVLDSKKVDLRGAFLQQPQPSPGMKYLAITLRGRMRETGIWDLENNTWARIGQPGGGCQINWFPSGDKVYWMNPSGNGGSEVFSTEVKDGKPVNPRASYQELRWIDLPGRRSHEYFPKLSSDGDWIVWCATIYGHDHDIYDYEVFCKKVGAPIEEAVRLTFHSGNDRWPDIHVMQTPEEEAP